MHPFASFAALAGLGFALGLLLRGGGSGRRRERPMPRYRAPSRRLGDGRDREAAMGPGTYAHRDQHVQRPSTLARH